MPNKRLGGKNATPSTIQIRIQSQSEKQQLQRRIEFLKYLRNHASWQLLSNGKFNLTPRAIV
jgi:hypothetical protein